MYQGKHVKARKSRISPVIVLASMILILAVATAGTVAFLVAPTDALVNQFIPGEVENDIEEDLTTTPEGDVLVKRNVKVENTGNVDAYIRAQIVYTWVQGEAVHAQVPVEDTDYEVTLGTGWIKRGDYYYWPAVVPAGDSTGNLIEECTAMDTEPEGYQLCVEILSQSIQAEPTTAVEQAWGFVPGT